jgi:hypothetical protein
VLCGQCDVVARGICRFCGRAVCGDHYSALPYIISVFGDAPPRSIVVGGTLWCGICRPQPEPIAMPELA